MPLLRHFTLILCFAGLLQSEESDRPAPRRLNQSLRMKEDNSSLRETLARILERSGLEWFIDQEIEGSVSLSLNRASWEQALEMVMRTNGLYQRRIGKMITIFPDAARTKAPPPQPVAVAVLPEVAAEQPVRLLGIVGSSEDRIAIVTYEGRDRMIRRGDALPNGAKVIRIEDAGVQVEDAEGKSRVYVF